MSFDVKKALAKLDDKKKKSMFDIVTAYDLREILTAGHSEEVELPHPRQGSIERRLLRLEEKMVICERNDDGLWRKVNRVEEEIPLNVEALDKHTERIDRLERLYEVMSEWHKPEKPVTEEKQTDMTSWVAEPKFKFKPSKPSECEHTWAKFEHPTEFCTKCSTNRYKASDPRKLIEIPQDVAERWVFRNSGSPYHVELLQAIKQAMK